MLVSLICWECDNAKSMEDCKAQKRARECNDNERTCQQEIRSWGAGGMYKSITQRCKQKHACVNNHVQNPRAAWLETQCQPFTHPENSVCRCCCHWNYCNGKEYAGCYGLKAAKEEFEKTSAAPETAGSTVAPSVTSPTEPYRTVAVSSTDGPTDGPPNAEGPTVPGVTEEPVTIDMLTMSPPPPACQWSQWTEWDKCSETCGGGQRNRYRNPVGGTVGSAGCEGYAEGVEYCATQDCEAKECNDNYVDVCFLIPVTNTTSARDLRMMKSFIRSCQGHIGDFGAEDLQFCVYQYNSDVQKVISLADSAEMTNKDFKDALDAMVPLNGTGADLSKAFDAIHQDGFNDASGWRRNDQIPSVLVVLTDLINDGSHYNSLVNVHSKNRSNALIAILA